MRRKKLLHRVIKGLQNKKGETAVVESTQNTRSNLKNQPPRLRPTSDGQARFHLVFFITLAFLVCAERMRRIGRMREGPSIRVLHRQYASNPLCLLRSFATRVSFARSVRG